MRRRRVAPGGAAHGREHRGDLAARWAKGLGRRRRGEGATFGRRIRTAPGPPTAVRRDGYRRRHPVAYNLGDEREGGRTVVDEEANASALTLEEARHVAVERHVTDPLAPVYGIVDLPEEVVAVIFAFVSRSPKSFRDNLAELVVEGLAGVAAGEPAQGGPERAFAHATERARAFHERWVVNYGHASVAEHATVHLGVERISRLASAALETASPFLSFTEFSQRYQAPVRGGYVTPPEVLGLPADLKAAYAKVQDRLFDAYEEILAGISNHLLAAGLEGERAGDKAGAAERRARRRAFEDARYALPLAVHTALGMTANGRALRDAVAALAESPWREMRDLGESLRAQGERMLPTLLRHADPAVPPAADAPWGDGRSAARAALLAGVGEAAGEADVRLLMAAPGDDAAARSALGAALALSGEGADGEDGVAFLRARRAASGPYALPHGAMRAVRYRFALRVSEANWHQLLRHTRGMTLFGAPPGVTDGITVPPMVARAGLEDRLVAACGEAQDLYARLVAAQSPGAAAYVVTNAHRRWVVADLDLWELDHLVRLRLKDNAQWDIRRSVREMVAAAAVRHPYLTELWGTEVLQALRDEAP